VLVVTVLALQKILFNKFIRYIGGVQLINTDDDAADDGNTILNFFTLLLNGPRPIIKSVQVKVRKRNLNTKQGKHGKLNGLDSNINYITTITLCDEKNILPLFLKK
jgi:hypothetical protein